jgi:tetratricopeptide (TPR) repeat protein
VKTRGLRLAVCSVLAVALAAGCSSAPKKQNQQFDLRNRAAETAKFGNDAFRKGDLDQAMRLFTLALALNAAADSSTGLVDSYNSVGKVHLARGAGDEAARHFRQALSIAQETGDAGLVARSRNNLGEAAFAASDFTGALTLFDEALATSGLPADVRAVILHNQGAALRRLSRTAEAAEKFNTALKINTREKNWYEAASNCYMLASLESEAGSFKGALDLARQALRYDRRVENSRGIANDYVALGKISARSGDQAGALDSFQRAVLVLRSMTVVDTRVIAGRELDEAARLAAETAERLGRNDEARAYRELLRGREQAH